MHYNDFITTASLMIVYRLFIRRSRKTSKLRVTGLCEGNSPMTGGFLAQMVNNTENVSIWWRHHGTMGSDFPRSWYPLSPLIHIFRIFRKFENIPAKALSDLLYTKWLFYPLLCIFGLSRTWKLLCIEITLIAKMNASLYFRIRKCDTNFIFFDTKSIVKHPP